ncbi:unnamed protein product [Ilex paraguariensis]|uniref:Folate-biopterin transporter 7 n=1 Tax=Ilex paraguariensis TaxID=185542 RepID=A0ABC8TQ90_9AQUA
MTLYLLLGNLGASVIEVANDAIVAEIGKQPTPSSKNSESSSSSELQSFVWMASSIGGVLGNLLCGVAIGRISPQAMFLLFGILLTVQFFITIFIHENSLDLPKSSSKVGIRKQLSELLVALKKPEISLSMTWFAASYAIIPALTGTMFYYQTQYLNIESSILGISKVLRQATICFVRERGISQAPDSLYVVVFSGFLEVLYFFKILPFSVLMAQLCPPGCEGSVMAFLMSAIALAFVLSGYLGIALASYVGVTGNDFSGLQCGLLIQAACTVLPLFWSSCIPDDVELRSKKKEN